MKNFQIISDGACDIGFERAAALGIALVPFYVSIDHETYRKEILELSLEDYFRYMTEEKGYPKTSLPSVQDYLDAFEPALRAGKDILCITITRTLSASLESAQTAKSMLEADYPHAKIYIVDSWLATGAQALLLQEMARMQQDGKTLEEVVAYIERAKADARIHFMVGDLSYLEIGGRIGKLATLSGSILKIKPLIVLKGGEINIGGICRSRKKGLSQLVEGVAKHFRDSGENPADYIAAVGTTTIWDDVEAFEAALRDAVKMDYQPSFQIGATIATHTGPGTTGVCFVKKYEAYER